MTTDPQSSRYLRANAMVFPGRLAKNLCRHHSANGTQLPLFTPCRPAADCAHSMKETFAPSTAASRGTICRRYTEVAAPRQKRESSFVDQEGELFAKAEATLCQTCDPSGSEGHSDSGQAKDEKSGYRMPPDDSGNLAITKSGASMSE